jgi:hypothetical protein
VVVMQLPSLAPKGGLDILPLLYCILQHNSKNCSSKIQDVVEDNLNF